MKASDEGLQHQRLREAVFEGNEAAVRRLLATGLDINWRDNTGDSVLSVTILDFCIEGAQPSWRYDMLRLLLTLGADPNVLDDEDGNMLLPACWVMDTPMLELLLNHGADPNRGVSWSPSMTLYTGAEKDYLYHVYDHHLPDLPTEADTADEAAWLQFLDGMARRHGKPRPEHLRLLRDRGALTSSELGQRLGCGDALPRWRSGRWTCQAAEE